MNNFTVAVGDIFVSSDRDREEILKYPKEAIVNGKSPLLSFATGIPLDGELTQTPCWINDVIEYDSDGYHKLRITCRWTKQRLGTRREAAIQGMALKALAIIATDFLIHRPATDFLIHRPAVIVETQFVPDLEKQYSRSFFDLFFYDLHYRDMDSLFPESLPWNFAMLVDTISFVLYSEVIFDLIDSSLQIERRHRDVWFPAEHNRLDLDARLLPDVRFIQSLYAI